MWCYFGEKVCINGRRDAKRDAADVEQKQTAEQWAFFLSHLKTPDDWKMTEFPRPPRTKKEEKEQEAKFTELQLPAKLHKARRLNRRRDRTRCAACPHAVMSCTGGHS